MLSKIMAVLGWQQPAMLNERLLERLLSGITASVFWGLLAAFVASLLILCIFFPGL